MSNGAITNGTVKWFNDERGIGYITGADGQEYFVHHSAIRCEGRRTLAEGQAVIFEPSRNDRGLRAENVTAEKLKAEIGKAETPNAEREQMREMLTAFEMLVGTFEQATGKRGDAVTLDEFMVWLEREVES